MNRLEPHLGQIGQERAGSIKYLELKLILRISELKVALIASLPSPEFALLTES